MFVVVLCHSDFSSATNSKDKIRLRNIRSINVLLPQNRSLITKVCEQAVAEFELETALESVKKVWSAQKFVVAPYSKNFNKDNVFILGDTEEIQRRLDDNQVGASRFASRRMCGLVSLCTRSALPSPYLIRALPD